ncbi:conserved oligomeric Golgi complex subunit 1 isoform X1 [Electrophorus electricus]|uniref:Conserved oligomeric Golgi complex subunit 1 n=1 Tax=Electrophorus electricus TaxID=8005 RepID=A0A4W4GE25_ELEEL|nr:conserved oligomeric Golgi complex subunit 1 isoform X1 [Electrophorus electricus]
MAALPAQSVRVSEIKDPTVLFERYSTDEIRAVERQVRGEIEQKKEELRQMVGERYRDLIDAADTIGEMRQRSQSVVQSLRDMYRYCSQLKHTKRTPQSRSKEEDQKESKERFYTMASQIKLLLEIPERIWSALESSQYLEATQLYLLCCHLHNQLHLEARGPHYSPVLSRFPILVRQVAATGHFRSTILLDSRAVLRGRAVSDQAISEALVSTMLLEDSSPRQALADFLLARKASIQQLLNQPQHGSGIKGQVCALVELLVTTLYQAYAVFYMPPEGRGAEPGWGAEPGLGCGLLFSTLENVTSSSATGGGRKVLRAEGSAGSWFKYLPPSVLDFQPTLRTLAQPIQGDLLRDTLHQWIDTCKEDMRAGVSALLLCVRSVKGLAAIRDGVWDLLGSEAVSLHWSTVCQRLLEQPLRLWEDLLQELFLQRLQAVVQEAMEVISTGSRQLLGSALRELEGQPTPAGFGRGVRYEADVAAFLWAETPGDLPGDAAWVSVSQRDPQAKSGLAMKTRALTPRVQTLCAVLDSRLKASLDDVQHYLPAETPRPDAAEDAAASFGCDADAVEQALREHCLACVRDILGSVQAELGATAPGSMSAILFMARLCQSLGELCPSLRQCVLGQRGAGPGDVGRGTPRQGRKLGKGGVAKSVEPSPAQAKWAGLKEELLDCSMEAYGIWSAAISKDLLSGFAGSLHAGTAGHVLSTATNWEEFEIQEEAESGKTVTSKIHLPVQPSSYVQSLLFHLCLEVNRVGGHALPSITLLELVKGCLDQVLQEYEKLSQPTESSEAVFLITQSRALQLLFDLRYLTVTLTSPLEEGRTSRSQQDPRIQQICDFLESHIDPFDLDVFTPHLNSNLNRVSQRTSVLLGLLPGWERQGTRRTGSLSSQEPSNILPLASSQIRFGLLPLSMTSSRKAKPSTIATDIATPLAVPSSIPASEDNFRPGNLFRQLASQEEEPASSSLFKLGWLSSMAK